MNTELILHPTAAWPKPRGKRRAQAKVAKPIKAATPTRDDLLVILAQKGLKTTTKHTKAELQLMIESGKYVRPAALDRQNAKRKASKI
jgi:hypothetical protein